jgi:chromate transporter
MWRHGKNAELLLQGEVFRMTNSERTGDAGATDNSPQRFDVARVYLKIGTIGFGGGFAVMDLIHGELVEKHQWLTEQRYQNMVALAEMAPGALTVNLLSGIAYRLGGIKTMVLATAALILPSFIITTLLAGLFLAWQNNPMVNGALEGLTAGVVGLLLAVTWSLVKKAPRHWCCLVVGLAALVLGLALPVNPIWLVLMGGMAGGFKVAVEAFRHGLMGAQSGKNRKE